MFTGIVSGCFTVSRVMREIDLIDYEVTLSPALVAGLVIGASVAIDGVCQTVVELSDTAASFQAIAETLSKTTLSDLRVGRQVNVERSVRFGEEIGGHVIAGHVFETGTVVSLDTRPSTKLLSNKNQSLALTIQCSTACIPYLYEKGFIAVDGASLTVGPVDLTHARFTVYLIPETLRRTTLAQKKVDDKVNLEIDDKTRIIVDTFQARFSHLEARLAVLEQALKACFHS